MVTEEELRRLEALADAAPAWPWTSSPQKGTPGHCLVAQVWDAEGKTLVEVEPTPREQDASATAAFIGASRAAIPALVAEVRRLRALALRIAEARRRSQDEGSTDHLDCCKGGSGFWYDALDEADALLGGKGGGA